MMSGCYILNDVGEAVPEPDLFKWGQWMQTAERHVGDTTIDGVRVSTVFLGLDYNFHAVGPDMERIPILFETIVFGGALDEIQERYASRAEAEAGHAAMVERVRLTQQQTDRLNPDVRS